MSDQKIISALSVSLLPLLVIISPYLIKIGVPIILWDDLQHITNRRYDSSETIWLNAVIFYGVYFVPKFIMNLGFPHFIDRFTIGYRFDDFSKTVKKIGKYRLSEQLIDKLLLSNENIDVADKLSASITMDFLITDYKYALDKLFCHTGIRVSIFMPTTENGIFEMGRAYISEFEDPEKNKITPFAEGKGYCGLAWATGKLVKGTFKNRFGKTDPQFEKRSPRSKRKCILCIPVKSEIGNEVVAIISIDSVRKWDFFLKEEHLEEIDESTEPVKIKIVQLIDAMKPSPERIPPVSKRPKPIRLNKS